MTSKEKFIEIYNQNITREGADKLLEYLLSPTSDFFTAPASTRFHGSYEGGLLEHSLNVYECLCDYIKHSKFCKKYGFEFSEESLAIVALLHDICKTNYYTTEMRNVKVDGQWVQRPYYKVEDSLPYGHGEKSVYMLSGFMKLSREEAMAINWHMGAFDDRAKNNAMILKNVFLKHKIAFLFHLADYMTTYLDEETIEN